MFRVDAAVNDGNSNIEWIIDSVDPGGGALQRAYPLHSIRWGLRGLRDGRGRIDRDTAGITD